MAKKSSEKDTEDRRGYGHKHTECEIFIFSDSIAIFSSDDSWDGFLSVVNYVRLFFQSFVVKQLPLRGAIAFGDVFLDRERAIFFGDAYMKAVNLEKKQEWIGVMIDESVEDAFKLFFTEDILITKHPIFYDMRWHTYPEICRYKVRLKLEECYLYLATKLEFESRDSKRDTNFFVSFSDSKEIFYVDEKGHRSQIHLTDNNTVKFNEMLVGMQNAQYKRKKLSAYEMKIFSAVREACVVKEAYTVNWLDGLNVGNENNEWMSHQKILEKVKNLLPTAQENNNVEKIYSNTSEYIEYINSHVQFPDGITGRSFKEQMNF